MRISKTTLSLSAAALLVSAPVVFAQSRDTGTAGAAISSPAIQTGTGVKATGNDGVATGRSEAPAGSLNSQTTGGLPDGTGAPQKGTATGGAVGSPKAPQ